eukprot:CAMPEP_0197515778 /NCGR_PEP_ID=MMETSP1318-20131121/796_1 /TAXON_ID=552666 /ORGANISM="Partenskyella glossopodia, Strain RCC365" /LENGTH=45 /DNA_ID= /DNA_START= /DNA_END= /DNA_ORIENTATION=
MSAIGMVWVLTLSSRRGKNIVTDQVTATSISVHDAATNPITSEIA